MPYWCDKKDCDIPSGKAYAYCLLHDCPFLRRCTKRALAKRKGRLAGK
ncbi:MAG: hypothetical protein WC455_11815 [Dehalococcoidia bacterium]